MRQLLEILRLHYGLGHSQRDVAIMVNVGKTTVQKYITLFAQNNFSWPMTEAELYQAVSDGKFSKLKKKPSNNGGSNTDGNVGEIDFPEVHHELKSHKHMTLKLIWEDLHLVNQVACTYEHFTRLYNKWLSTQPSVMRQSHRAGEKIFVDYSGDKIPLYDNEGTIVNHVEIFVGVLGASNYIYIEATMSQKSSDFIMSHVRMFEHLGGTPEIVMSDNLKAGVKRPNRYDPIIAPAYYDMLSYYGVAAMPARVYKPKDKAKVENGVLIIQRWVLARLRNSKFTALADLNAELKILMSIANNKQLQRYPHTRNELFTMLDRPVLRQLPDTAYVYREHKKARVNGDYHVELYGHYYSVPYTLVKSEVDIWYTTNLVECYYHGKCVAKHVRSYKQMNKTTVLEHMPISHKCYAQEDITTLKTKAQEVGIATGLIVEHIFENAHASIASRRATGFLKLIDKYSESKLESICEYAISIGIYDYKNIQILLERTKSSILQHSNIRGSGYYM
jgi:transposase